MDAFLTTQHIVIKYILCNVLNDKNVTSTKLKNLGIKKEEIMTKPRVQV